MESAKNSGNEASEYAREFSGEDDLSPRRQNTNDISDTVQEDIVPPPTCKKIRHIVLSGGGGIGNTFYGTLRESNKDGFWHVDDIQTMHGTSTGTIFMILVSTVKYIGWDIYDDFVIKRPWETVLEFKAETILNSYKNVGIFGQEPLNSMIVPILKALDLSLNVTLQEFHEFVGIELHFYATDLKRFELVDISHKTHPDWKILDAVYASCALPILFQPCKIADCYYADGALFCNYPIKQCIEMADHPDEVFGLNKVSREETKPPENYGNLVEYLQDILNKTVYKLAYETVDVKHTIMFEDDLTSATQVYNAIKTKEARIAKVQMGVDAWNAFKQKIGFVKDH